MDRYLDEDRRDKLLWKVFKLRINEEYCGLRDPTKAISIHVRFKGVTKKPFSPKLTNSSIYIGSWAQNLIHRDFSYKPRSLCWKPLDLSFWEHTIKLIQTQGLRAENGDWHHVLSIQVDTGCYSYVHFDLEISTSKEFNYAFICSRFHNPSIYWDLDKFRDHLRWLCTEAVYVVKLISVRGLSTWVFSYGSRNYFEEIFHPSTFLSSSFSKEEYSVVNQVQNFRNFFYRVNNGDIKVENNYKV